MRDAYIDFFGKTSITKKEFFNFGLSETIYAKNDEEINNEWKHLKKKIVNNEAVYIRGFGRDSKGTIVFIKLYEKLFGNFNIKKDPTNNAVPTKIVAKITHCSKTENKNYELIRNFQISHVFGRTKNVYTFTAPWNIVYIPKLLDPFTGHEAKGEMIEEFTKLFQRQTYKKYKKYIDDYNKIVSNKTFLGELNKSVAAVIKELKLSQSEAAKFQKSVTEEFSKIIIK